METPTIAYARKPTARVGNERLRHIPREDGTAGATIVVFRRGFWNLHYVFGPVFGLGVAIVLMIVQPSPVTLLVLPCFLLVVLAWNVYASHDEANRQHEIDVGPDGLLCVSFGPDGVQQRR